MIISPRARVARQIPEAVRWGCPGVAVSSVPGRGRRAERIGLALRGVNWLPFGSELDEQRSGVFRSG